MAATTTVHVGGQDYTLRPFRAYKAIIAGELISRVGDEIRTLLSALRSYEAEYRASNVTRFTRAQAIARQWELPPDAFVTPSEGGEPYIDLPAVPTAEERMMFVFPRAFKLAQGEVTRLLALLVISDEEMRVADGAGQGDAALDKLGERLIHEGEIGEIIELLAAGVEHAQAQLAGHQGALGKLRAFARSLTRTPQPEETDDRKRTREPMTIISESPDSSTSSPTPTDGAETESSSASPTGSFST